MKNNVKLLGMAAAYTVASSTSAFAADFDENPADAFAGGFAGLGVGLLSAKLHGDETYGANSTPVFSGFVGYNWVHGDYIIGAEGSGTLGEPYNTSDGYDYGVTRVWDLKLRVGRTFEMAPNSQMYMSAGIFHADFDYYDKDYSGHAIGLSVGGGFETNITENMFVAVDGTVRFSTDTDIKTSGYSKDVGPIYTLAARVGFRF